jgi:hypothetical protein
MTTDKLPTEAMIEAVDYLVKMARQYEAAFIRVPGAVHGAGERLEQAKRELYLAMEAVRPPVGEEVVLRVRDAIRRVKEERHAPITGDEELEARAAILAMQSNG